MAHTRVAKWRLTAESTLFKVTLPQPGHRILRGTSRKSSIQRESLNRVDRWVVGDPKDDPVKRLSSPPSQP